MAFGKPRIRIRSARRFVLIFATLLSGCGTTRPDQTPDHLLRQRAQYAQRFLDETNERYTALLEGIKRDLDDYKAGRRPDPPCIDYLVVSGGGDYGAFGAGVLKGWRSVPASDPLARPRFDVVTGVSTGALIAPFAYLDDPAEDARIIDLYRNPGPDWIKTRWPISLLPSNLSLDAPWAD